MIAEKVFDFAGICLLVAVLGFIVRRRFPRFAVAAFGLAICAAGVWTVVSTLELDAQGLAHTFSRGMGTFSASVAPEAARLSFWFNTLLGGFSALVGCLFMVLPFTARGHRLKFPPKEEQSWSVLGVFKVLGLFVVIFVIIVVWKIFVR